MSDTPILETERLTMRSHSIRDLDDCVALWGDPSVTRHIGGRTFTREETWARLLRYVGHWRLLGFGYWVAVERSTGRFVGEVGYADFQRDMTPSIAGAPEMGWVLAPHAHGRGFATEAVRAAMAWADAHFGSKRQVCIIDPDNGASIRVAEKCGFVECARTAYKDTPVILFERGSSRA